MDIYILTFINNYGQEIPEEKELEQIIKSALNFYGVEINLKKINNK